MSGGSKDRTAQTKRQVKENRAEIRAVGSEDLLTPSPHIPGAIGLMVAGNGMPKKRPQRVMPLGVQVPT